MVRAEETHIFIRLLLLILAATGPLSAEEPTQSPIAPEHALPYFPGWIRFSDSGSWLSNTHSVRKKNTRDLYLYGLDSEPVREVTPSDGLIKGHSMNYAFDRWYIEQGFRVWDLETKPVRLALDLPYQDGWQSCLTSDDGRWLATKFKHANETCLRLFDLEQSEITENDFHELGDITGFDRFRPFFFTDHSGLLSIKDNTLLRWDLEQLDKPPEEFVIKPGLQRVHNLSLRRDGQLVAANCRLFCWMSDSEKYYCTFFPMDPANSKVIPLIGRPAGFDGESLIVQKDDRYWLGRLLPTQSAFRLLPEAPLPEANGRRFRGNQDSYSHAEFIASGKLLLMIESTPFLDMTGSGRSWIQPLDPNEAPYGLNAWALGVAGTHEAHYFHSTNGNWLASLAKQEMRLWDLRDIGDGVASGSTRIPLNVSAAFLFHDRYLIVADHQNILYALDLNQDRSPTPKFFFSLQHKGRPISTASNSRFCFVEGTTQKILVWNERDLANLESSEQ